MLRNNYLTISKLAKEFEEPIFFIENGKHNGVFMSIKTFEKREQLLDLHVSRLNGKSRFIPISIFDYLLLVLCPLRAS